MTLTPGTRIGPYEITGTLGAGGMGEVYRARDARLNRDVALKVLPDAFADDPERLARFEREAQVLATLKHPNIASIYGLEEDAAAGGRASTRALVLELVEGETLAERIERGRLPVEEAIPIARQIVEALQSAHELGVIHRDLKPANVKVQPDGVVKVLDFGLAKLTEAGTAVGAGRESTGGLAALSQSPTLASPVMMTGVGVILGTAAYMAPEQAKGRPADKRSDVWAFGCVLFEMLSGRRAFEGDDLSDMLASVLKGEPGWNTLPAGLPPAVRALIEGCLQKDPRNRIADLAAARFVLERPSLGAHAPAPPTAAPRPALLKRLLIPVAAVVVGALISGAAVWFATRPAPNTDVTRFSVSLPEGTRFSGAAKASAVSPDGRRLLMLALKPGSPPMLWVQSLDSLTAQLLPGTEGALNPVWSPDGSEIAFFADGKVKKVDAAGGPPQTLCDASVSGGSVSGGLVTGAQGITWSPDGYLVFGNTPGVLMRVSALGGEPQPISDLDSARGEIGHSWPFMLPDGRHFLYVAVNRDRSKSQVFVGTFDSSERRLVMTNDAEVMYAEPGYVLFLRQAALMAQRFDPMTFELQGEAVPLADEIGRSTGGALTFSISRTGVLTYRPTRDASGRLTWFDREGRQTEIQDVPAGSYSGLELSPDGRFLAFVRADDLGSQDIWLHDLTRGISSRLTSADGNESAPQWSPDGRYVAYSSPRGIVRRLSNGTGDEELISAVQANNVRTTDWTSNGQLIAFSQIDKTQDLWLLPLDGDRTPQRLLQTEFSEREARFSPDGRWLAYSSSQSGPFEIYIRSNTPVPGQWQISNGGGIEPKWKRDGTELFYLRPDGALMAVSIARSADGINAGVPRQLFETRYAINTNMTATSRSDYAVSADGQRFLAVTSGDDGASPSTFVVLNWPALLNR